MSRWWVALVVLASACKQPEPAPAVPAPKKQPEVRVTPVDLHPSSTSPHVEPIPVCDSGELDSLSTIVLAVTSGW